MREEKKIFSSFCSVARLVISVYRPANWHAYLKTIQKTGRTLATQCTARVSCPLIHACLQVSPRSGYGIYVRDKTIFPRTPSVTTRMPTTRWSLYVSLWLLIRAYRIVSRRSRFGIYVRDKTIFPRSPFCGYKNAYNTQIALCPSLTFNPRLSYSFTSFKVWLDE